MRYVKAKELKPGNEVRFLGNWYKVEDVIVGYVKAAVQVEAKAGYPTIIEFNESGVDVLIRDPAPDPCDGGDPLWRIRYTRHGGLVSAKLVAGKPDGSRDVHGPWRCTEADAQSALLQQLARAAR